MVDSIHQSEQIYLQKGIRVRLLFPGEMKIKSKWTLPRLACILLSYYNKWLVQVMPQLWCIYS